MSAEQVFGLLNIHKPSGPTSHDIVALVRRGTGVRKVGHAGTLDPLASGVLVLCLGPATRLSEYVMRSPKHYQARVRLGITTDTYDAAGAVVAEEPVGDLSMGQIESELDAFRGAIMQVPPMYSAIKRKGKKLYELARAGQEVAREPRPVTIDRLTVTQYEPPFLTLDVECSPGTYIRSLAHDLGQRLGVGAHLAALIRLASGAFHLENAVLLDTLKVAIDDGSWRQYLLQPDMALSDLPTVILDADQVRRVAHGNAISAPPDSAGQAKAVGLDGCLLAILEFANGYWQPIKVFLPEK